MNRSLLYGLTAISAVSVTALASRTALSERGQSGALVRLQLTTPGVVQSGHANLSGTIRAGQFVGGGAGLTNLTWANIVGVPGTILTLPYSGSTAGSGFSVSTTSAAANAYALRGVASGATGQNYGGLFTNASNAGAAVVGLTTAANGLTSGGFFSSESTTARTVYATANATSGVTYGGYFVNSSPTGYGIFAVVPANSGQSYGGFFEVNSPDGIAVRGNNKAGTGLAIAGSFTTASSGGIGVSGVNSSTSGATAYGGYFRSDSSTGSAIYAEGGRKGGEFFGDFSGIEATMSNSGGLYAGRFTHVGTTTGAAVYGTSAGAEGGSFETTSASTIVQRAAVRGSAVILGGNFSANHALGTGVKGTNSATTGEALGGLFQTSSTAGIALSGKATAATGSTYGGSFTIASPSGAAVFGTTQNTTGNAFAGYFVANGDSGVGVYGEVTADVGDGYGGFFATNGDDGIGAYAAARSTTGTIYGLYGYAASVGVLDYGVFANGDLGATGVKSFRIDHPQDPENKYLVHYSTESPYPQNCYNGVIETDAKGYATVALPDYFAEINTNFRYQLTVLSDDFVQAVVSKQVSGNTFQVRTSKPNTRVSWEVKADRNDPNVRRRKLTDVVEKVGKERGKYQRPEEYGLGPEHGIEATRDPKTRNARNKPASEKR